MYISHAVNWSSNKKRSYVSDIFYKTFSFKNTFKFLNWGVLNIKKKKILVYFVHYFSDIGDVSERHNWSQCRARLFLQPERQEIQVHQGLGSAALCDREPQVLYA